MAIAASADAMSTDTPARPLDKTTAVKQDKRSGPLQHKEDATVNPALDGLSVHPRVRSSLNKAWARIGGDYPKSDDTDGLRRAALALVLVHSLPELGVVVRDRSLRIVTAKELLKKHYVRHLEDCALGQPPGSYLATYFPHRNGGHYHSQQRLDEGTGSLREPIGDEVANVVTCKDRSSPIVLPPTILRMRLVNKQFDSGVCAGFWQGNTFSFRSPKEMTQLSVMAGEASRKSGGAESRYAQEVRRIQHVEIWFRSYGSQGYVEIAKAMRDLRSLRVFLSHKAPEVTFRKAPDRGIGIGKNELKKADGLGEFLKAFSASCTKLETVEVAGTDLVMVDDGNHGFYKHEADINATGAVGEYIKSSLMQTGLGNGDDVSGRGGHSKSGIPVTKRRRTADEAGGSVTTATGAKRRRNKQART